AGCRDARHRHSHFRDGAAGPSRHVVASLRAGQRRNERIPQARRAMGFETLERKRMILEQITEQLTETLKSRVLTLFGHAVDRVIVEHTNINPNKAAHIGHLRNAVLGDTLVRCLKWLGDRVETQNYIDDTGVQVADVVVGFEHLEKKSLDDARAMIDDPNVR